MTIDSSLALELLTIHEVAKILKISISSVRRLLDARSITFHKVGGSVRVAMSDILSYLQKQRVGSFG